MKYKCNVIKDLLPLYIEKITSQDSNEIIEEHLKECESCKKYFVELKDESFLEDLKEVDDNKENPKKTMKNIKRKIIRSKLLFVLIAIIIVIITLFSIYSYMNNKIVPIQYDNNISIKEQNGNVYAVLKNNSYVNAKSKIVEITDEEGKTEKCLYFYFSTTLWESFFKPLSDYYTEYELIPSDKEKVDKIYYYVGDYTDLEEKENIENVTIMWEK